MGSAIAYELSRASYSVTVIDKASGPGQGSTSSSSAVIRFNYSTLAGVALAWESYRLWQDWREHLQAPGDEHLAELIQTGVAMLDVPLFDTEHTERLYQQCQIPYEMWNAETLQNKIPAIDAGKYWPPKKISDPEFFSDATSSLGAMYTPDGGYINDPSLSAINLASAAQRHGARFLFKSRVVRILHDHRIRGVVLDDGSEISADIVVNAAGPWSTQINAMAGVGHDFTVSLRALRQEVHHVDLPSSMYGIPMVGDLDVGTYSRTTPGNGFLVGGTEPECDPLHWVDDPDEVNMVRTSESFEAQVTRAARRFPDLGIPSSPKGIVGVYDVSSDWTPIYDCSSLPGFYLAIGTSGNQFKNAPGVGVIMRHLIDAVEDGTNHDKEPVVVTGAKTKLPIDLGTFSRKRERNADSTGTVMG